MATIARYRFENNGNDETGNYNLMRARTATQQPQQDTSTTEHY